MRRDHIFDPVRHNGYSIGDLRRFTKDDEKKMTRRVVVDTPSKSGHVEWDNEKEKQRCYVMWRTPDEWADQIYAWIEQNGMTDTVCTLYELHSGDDTSREEFHGIDINVLKKALQSLERRGKAQIFSAEDPAEVGVKFFA